MRICTGGRGKEKRKREGQRERGTGRERERKTQRKLSSSEDFPVAGSSPLRAPSVYSVLGLFKRHLYPSDDLLLLLKPVFVGFVH